MRGGARNRMLGTLGFSVPKRNHVIRRMNHIDIAHQPRTTTVLVPIGHEYLNLYIEFPRPFFCEFVSTGGTT